MDVNEIKRTLSVFRNSDTDLFEIRLFNPLNKYDIYSGIFRDADKAIENILRFDDKYNIYFIFNQLKDAMDGYPQYNKMIKGCEAIKDNDIKYRNWVLVDLDPVREGGVKEIATTDEELERARQMALSVRRFLRENGFFSPIVSMSGNGYHLMFKVDKLENTPENTLILSNFLKYLGSKFTDEYVDVDLKVFNPARVTKLYGTYSRKGGNTPKRPHRLSKILVVPECIQSNDISLFKNLADMLPKTEPINRYNLGNREQFDIDNFISNYGIKVHKDITMGDGTRKIVLSECPFDPSHKAPDSAIFVSKDGIGFTCFHNSCSQYTWRDLRLKFEPNAYDIKSQAHNTAIPYQRNQYTSKKEQKVKEETPELGKKWFRMKDIPKIDLNNIISLKTGFHSLDRAIVGLNLGEVSLLSGTNSSGKSSWLNTLILNVVNNGHKAALWSGELVPGVLKTWLEMVAAGRENLLESRKNIGKFYINPSVIDKIDNWLDDKFFLYNNEYGSKWAQLFNDMKEMVDNGVELLILDNLFTLDIDLFEGDKNNKQKELILQICEFSKKNNIHLILVCHPRKQVDFLRKDSISGTADLTNAASNVFIIHRVNKDFEKRGGEFFGKEAITAMMDYGNVLEVAKNRMYGIVDYMCGMYYDIPSRRFMNEENENIHYGWENPSPAIPIFKENNDHIYNGYQREYSSDNLPFSEPTDELPF